jgi:muconolactone delta-isomerase
MLFLLWFKVRQPERLSQQQLMEIWQREADAALAGVRAGKVKALYKVSGKREVVAVLEVGSHEELDAILEGTPLMKELGPWVDVDVYPIHPYENFRELIRKLAEARR